MFDLNGGLLQLFTTIDVTKIHKLSIPQRCINRIIIKEISLIGLRCDVPDTFHLPPGIAANVFGQYDVDQPSTTMTLPTDYRYIYRRNLEIVYNLHLPAHKRFEHFVGLLMNALTWSQFADISLGYLHSIGLDGTDVGGDLITLIQQIQCKYYGKGSPVKLDAVLKLIRLSELMGLSPVFAVNKCSEAPSGAIVNKCVPNIILRSKSMTSKRLTCN